MGCGSSSQIISPELSEKLAKTGHSTGEQCGKLTLREWNNLTFETKNFIAEIDALRDAQNIHFESCDINVEGGLQGHYAGECDANGKAYGEGTFMQTGSMKEYRGTFKDNAIFGYVVFIGKDKAEGKGGKP